MSKRISQTILLCEDEAQERFVKAYMKRCGLQTKSPVVKALVASRMLYGGNDQWVLNRFPEELHACRQRLKKAKTLLIVVLNADKYTVKDRQTQLLERLTSAGFDKFKDDEPAVIRIPKRHIETWIECLLGATVTEDEKCKTQQKHKKEDLKKAADTLHVWTRENAEPDATCVASLKTALPEWRKIG